jgi:hypothetical protein
VVECDTFLLIVMAERGLSHDSAARRAGPVVFKPDTDTGVAVAVSTPVTNSEISGNVILRTQDARDWVRFDLTADPTFLVSPIGCARRRQNVVDI